MFVYQGLAFSGALIWLAATAALRLWGQRILHPDSPRSVLILFLASFLLMFWLARRLCRRFGLPRERWLEGSFALALPTLLLDPFSCAFFPHVFPNIPAAAAGLFGGWILCCCFGALAGAVRWR